MERIESKILSGLDNDLGVTMLQGRGRGVFPTRKFWKGEYVCEYAGDLIKIEEAKKREVEYEKTPHVGSFMFYFDFESEKYCIDASQESSRLGRLFNHRRIDNNVLIRVVSVENIPRLILVASRDIEIGTEMVYDYGDRSKLSIECHPWLKL